MGRDTYSESYTSRQEIVPLDKSTQASAKESPPPWPGALISNGASYRIPRIRCADPHRLRPPAGALARGSNPCGVTIKEKPPLPEALSSIGAAYRIRTYDVLIRSQTLYPAEVTPQRKTYKTTLAYWSQAQSQTFCGTQFCHAAPHIPPFPVRSIGFSITSNLASSSLRSDLTR